MNIALKSLIINDACQVYTLPEIEALAIKAIKSDDSSAKDVAEIIEKDSALTGTILKIANSAAYGMPKKIEDVKTAVSLIGYQELGQLIISAIACNKINSQAPESLNIKKFWLKTLAISYILEKLSLFYLKKSIFTVGILHDIGTLVLMKEFNKQQTKIEKLSNGLFLTKIALERDTYGFSSIDITEKILRNWGLPDTFHQAIKFHEKPEDTSITSRLSPLLLYTARRMMDERPWIYNGTDNLVDVYIKFKDMNQSINMELLSQIKNESEEKANAILACFCKLGTVDKIHA